jgi:hypothetical protein
MFAIERNSNFVSSTSSCCALSGGLFSPAHTAGILTVVSQFHISFQEISPCQKPVELVEPNRVFNETIHTRVQQFG